VIVRLFNTVGPRQTGRYGMVIPNFVRQALLNEDITVFGDGSQTRCFTHVADVVDALVRVMEDDRSAGEVFNIGSNMEVTILELAQRVKCLTHSQSDIRFVPYGEAYEEGFEDMMRRVPDISKIRQLIGYQPNTDLDKLLMSVIKDQRERLPTAAQAPCFAEAN
jgi:UDP-glucose 4-epimerase